MEFKGPLFSNRETHKNENTTDLTGVGQCVQFRAEPTHSHLLEEETAMTEELHKRANGIYLTRRPQRPQG